MHRVTVTLVHLANTLENSKLFVSCHVGADDGGAQHVLIGPHLRSLVCRWLSRRERDWGTRKQCTVNQDPVIPPVLIDAFTGRQSAFASRGSHPTLVGATERARSL